MAMVNHYLGTKLRGPDPSRVSRVPKAGRQVVDDVSIRLKPWTLCFHQMTSSAIARGPAAAGLCPLIVHTSKRAEDRGSRNGRVGLAAQAAQAGGSCLRDTPLSTTEQFEQASPLVNGKLSARKFRPLESSELNIASLNNVRCFDGESASWPSWSRSSDRGVRDNGGGV